MGALGRSAGAAAILVGGAAPAYGHGFGQRYDLPLPLDLYLVGAALAVLLSFLVMALFLRTAPQGRGYPRLDLLGFGLGRGLAHPVLLGLCRAVSAGLFLLILAAGFFGDQNPVKNIDPTLVWIIWWVGLAYVCALLGDLWMLINPWKIWFAWAEALLARIRPGARLSLGLAYPEWLGVWPAVLLFWAFAWCELIWPESAVPASLARVILIYSVITWGGMVLFGPDRWLAAGEAFTVAFGLLARFAPSEIRVLDPAVCQSCALACRPGAEDCVNCPACFARAGAQQRQWNLRPWAVGLLTRHPLSASYVMFTLLLLASVSFDGLLSTELWNNLAGTLHGLLADLGWLEGLSAVGLYPTLAVQSLGLIGLPLLFAVCYLFVSRLMAVVTGSLDDRGRPATGALARLFVLTLVPIAVAYHLAHYLTYLLTVGQFIIPLASDPFGYGWDLFATRDYRIDIAVVGAKFTWYITVVAIVLGHVIAVYLAHVMALAIFPNRRLALLSQGPMLVLMVAYTVFSLWMLAEPIVE